MNVVHKCWLGNCRFKSNQGWISQPIFIFLRIVVTTEAVIKHNRYKLKEFVSQLMWNHKIWTILPLYPGVDVSYIDEVNILQDISSRLEEWTVSLQKSHDYHSCTWINREPVTRKQKSQSSIEDIYVAVHSLDLHLQAALARYKPFRLESFIAL